MKFLCAVLLVLGCTITALGQQGGNIAKSLSPAPTTRYLQREVDSLKELTLKLFWKDHEEIDSLQSAIVEFGQIVYALSDVMMKLTEKNERLERRLEKLEGNKRETFQPFNSQPSGNKENYVGNH